jgi:selT/selW/selH-like putative selenoprotein
LAGEIIEEFGDDLETITLVKGNKGRFEVALDGATIFSKSASKRHPQPGEVTGNIRGMRARASAETE